ncbi:MAG: hypothetical protein AAFR87_14325 [Bacteroidota bacterium]
MRNLYTISLYAFICISLFFTACTENISRIGPSPEEEFFKLHGGAFDQQGIDLLENEGGFLLLGTTSTTTEGESGEMYLVQTDELGNNQFTAVFSPTLTGADATSHAMTATSDGGFLLSGTVVDEEGQSDAWLVKVNSSLELMWQQTYGGPFTDETALAVEEAPDGSIYVLGSTSEVDPLKVPGPQGVRDSSDVSLMKLDPGGNIIWSKTYGYTGTDKGSDLIILGDDEILVLGTTDFPDDGSLDKDVLLILMNAEGNPFNTQTFGEAGIDEIASRFTLLDDKVFITGEQKQGSTSNVLFLSVDNQLEAVAGPLGISNTRYTVGFDIKPTVDGSGRFIISGTGDTEDDAKLDILILRVDESGTDLDGPKFIGNQRNDSGAALLVQNNDLVMIGTTQFLSNTMMTLLKFDIDGDL